MSLFTENLIERIKELLSDNEEINRKEFLAATGKIFSELKGKPERKKKETKSKKAVEVKAKRAPSKYNIYMKEHMPILSAREKEKTEDKKTTRELMQEIGEMWALEKERVKSESDQSSDHDDKPKVEKASTKKPVKETVKDEKKSSKKPVKEVVKDEIEEEEDEIEEEEEEIEDEEEEKS